MYVETGATDGDTVSLAFSVIGTTNNQWNIRVSQIPCSASYRFNLYKYNILAEVPGVGRGI